MFTQILFTTAIALILRILLVFWKIIWIILKAVYKIKHIISYISKKLIFFHGQKMISSCKESEPQTRAGPLLLLCHVFTLLLCCKSKLPLGCNEYGVLVWIHSWIEYLIPPVPNLSIQMCGSYPDRCGLCQYCYPYSYP